MASRQVTIKFLNSSRYRMHNSCDYEYSGYCESPLPPYLDSDLSNSGSAVFSKFYNSRWGTAGVVTYDLLKNSSESVGTMAVMFSNPNIFALYSNWFAVGVFESGKSCDHDLYYKMYYGEEEGFVRGKAKDLGLTYDGQAVAISATMSDSYKPVIKVQVSNYSK
ncbi:DELTA-thalatoxin-Avl1a-like [Labrus mixtus]|uniref:DELTA-thalatoxin-Avl1a-like n=1 Tax=Labrus mixtus TaxID=508554 RepID=UPI0029C08EE5|nr:DELTA-thalatoxin-Avl1a-like [Labrus mixtus]